MTYEHVPHPRHAERPASAPKVQDEHVGVNGRIAVAITRLVGSMWCAYIFAAIALVSLPEAIKGGVATTVSWIAQTFLQLVLLSIIMVGQDVASKASDRTAAETWADAEALLHEVVEIQRHLAAQDEVLAQRTKRKASNGTDSNPS